MECSKIGLYAFHYYSLNMERYLRTKRPILSCSTMWTWLPGICWLLPFAQFYGRSPGKIQSAVFKAILLMGRTWEPESNHDPGSGRTVNTLVLLNIYFSLCKLRIEMPLVLSTFLAMIKFLTKASKSSFWLMVWGYNPSWQRRCGGQNPSWLVTLHLQSGGKKMDAGAQPSSF